MKKILLALSFLVSFISFSQTEEIYDQAGKLEKKVEYNNNGKVIENIFYNSDGSIDRRESYLRDKNDHIVEEFHYSNEKLVFRWVNEYDYRGNKISALYYGKKGSLSSKYYYKYDDRGNKIEQQFHYGPGLSLIELKVYEYENDKKIKETMYNSGRLHKTYYFEYNEQGVLIETKGFWADGTRISGL